MVAYIAYLLNYREYVCEYMYIKVHICNMYMLQYFPRYILIFT